MKKRIQHIAPLQLGIVLATLYGALSLICVPVIIFYSLAAKSQNSSGFFAGGILFIILSPLLYAAAGFIGGIIAGWTGPDAVPK